MYTLQSDLTQVPNYTGDEYEQFLKNSALAGWGGTFAALGKKYGINPIYLIALTVFESGWGTSNFAKTRNNYWGYAAFDSNVNLAATFTTPFQGLEFIACWLKNTWLTPPQVVNGKKMVYQLPPYQVGKTVQYSIIGGWWAGAPTLEGVYKIGQFEGQPGKYATAPHAAYSMLALMNQVIQVLGSPVGSITVVSAPIQGDTTDVYTVKAGDSLWKIAQTIYNDPSKWHDLATANSIAGPNYVIHPGQQLKLPGKSRPVTDGGSSGVQSGANRTYTIGSGDSLWSIAVKFYGDGRRYNDIYTANKDIIGDNPNLIRAGQTLRIP